MSQHGMISTQDDTSPKKRKTKSTMSAQPTIKVMPTAEDTGDTSLRIEKELAKKYVGTVKLYHSQVVAEWDHEGGLVSNREVDEVAIKKLVERFAAGLDRMNQRHHMAAKISADVLAKLCQVLDIMTATLLEVSASYNYPLTSPSIWDDEPLVLQAGQHRFAAIDRM